ncbi:MAG: NAD-dependent malic enzyme [Chloroflexota bacterium]|nr:MAG: NAD-dependent malic enzyme [Chloroflexota bacterium]
MTHTPNPSYSFTLRCELDNRPGMLGMILSAVGAVGGDMGHIDIVSADRRIMVRDITVNAIDERHAVKIVDQVQSLLGVRVVNVSDRTFSAHMGGKIEIANKISVKTRDDLSMVYTPGVARVCLAIADEPSKAFSLTIRRNMVAVVTDGSAVLGLGDIGPGAALPVMEGKAMLFKEFAGVDAFPICLQTHDVDEIVATVERISTSFGGINLEDISAPRCFEVEERLRERLDIPVFHDDQHGTAVVVLAALLNALKIVHKSIDEIRVVVNGMGAAGIACTKTLLAAGVGDIIGCDREGAIYDGRTTDMNPVKQWIARNTNRKGVRGTLHTAMMGADVFLGVSAPGVVGVEDVKNMAPDPIVFALANPEPEIAPEDIYGCARVVATGRSDYPNQINNVLCFPGIFRGALDCQATLINESMKKAAAKAIAEMVSSEELSEEYIVPSVFNRQVSDAVARAVVEAAMATGAARRPTVRLHPSARAKE